MNEYDLLLRIEELRQKLEWAQDQDDVDISMNLLFALMQEYETLYQLRREQILNLKQGA